MSSSKCSYICKKPVLILPNFVYLFSIFFFRLLPIRGRHSVKVFSTSLGRLHLLPWLQPFLCLLLPNPSTFSLAFLFSFCLAPPSPSSFFPRSLLLPFFTCHTSVALHSEVCLLALRFSQSLSRIRFLSCSFLCPFHHFQLWNFHFSHLSFLHCHRFHSIKHGWSDNALVHFTLNPC